MVEELGAGYQYMGVATPTTNPGTLDCRCFYIASAAGTYTYFKNSSNVALVVNDGEVAILKYDTSWSKEVTGAATAAQVTQLGQYVNGDEQFSVVPNSGWYLGYTYGNASFDRNPSRSLFFINNLAPGTVLTVQSAGIVDFNVSEFEVPELTINTKKTRVVSSGWQSVSTYTITLGSTTQSVALILKTDVEATANAAITSVSFFRNDGVFLRQEKYLSEVGEMTSQQKSVAVTNWVSGTFVNGAYGADGTRIIGTANLDGVQGTFNVAVVSGYKVSLRLVSVAAFNPPTTITGVSNSQILYASGWQSEDFSVNIPAGTKSAIIVFAYTSNAYIGVDKSGNASYSFTGTRTLVAEADVLESEIEKLKNDALMSASVSGLSQITFTASDLEKGTIYQSVEDSSTNAMRTVNRYMCYQNGVLRFVYGQRSDTNTWYVRVVQYDDSGTYISGLNESWTNASSFKLDKRTRYVRIVFRLTDTGGSGVAFDDVESELEEGSVGVVFEGLNLTPLSFVEQIEEKVDRLPLVDNPDGYYTGEKINVRNPFKVLAHRNIENIKRHQSMAIYGNYMVTAYTDNGEAKGQVIDLTTYTILATITFDLGGFHLPHCNVCCFGNEFAEGNNTLPLFYLSQWDYEYERGCLVYDIQESGGTWTATLVQKIKPNNIGTGILGAGCVDWIVDTDNSCLYALGYYLAGSSTIVEGNKEMVVKFSLPKIADGSSILLSESDVVDNYSVLMWNFSQDKTYVDGKVYVIAGGGPQYGTPEMNRLYVLDLVQKQVVSIVHCENVFTAEPEGLSEKNGDLLFTYGYTPVYKFVF